MSDNSDPWSEYKQHELLQSEHDDLGTISEGLSQRQQSRLMVLVVQPKPSC